MTESIGEGRKEGRMGWILDGSGILKILENGNLGSAPDVQSRSSKKANAIFEDGGIRNGEHKYYELSMIRAEPSATWFGITTRRKFGPGYKLKGVFFGGPGNTSDGSALVKSQFHDSGLAEGDLVGMEVDVGAKLRVKYFVNNYFIGEAFCLDDYPRDETLFPAVSTNGKSELSMRIKDSPPETLNRIPETSGITGKWVPDGDDFGSNKPTLSVHSTNDIIQYRVSAKCANTISASVTISGDNASAGGVMSTMMMAPPEWQDSEKKTMNLLGTLTRFYLDGNKLMVDAPGGSQVFSRRSPETPAPTSKVPSFSS
eukprot:CAMPEP_0184753496 /NCGR_PEP_ID=MMETSP0315-20130426/44133_1 /TAXON_ID=101924 /ORGANISM="Rhodosorus marinus, Strain UTEX LB 2760" /LENGTH=313 /DNA_ID=CAMNT_0027232877 /DNA_START=6 /DNA_END=947 /DNA_ORIENTATION=+